MIGTRANWRTVVSQSSRSVGWTWSRKNMWKKLNCSSRTRQFRLKIINESQTQAFLGILRNESAEFAKMQLTNVFPTAFSLFSMIKASLSILVIEKIWSQWWKMSFQIAARWTFKLNYEIKRKFAEFNIFCSESNLSYLSFPIRYYLFPQNIELHRWTFPRQYSPP